MMAVHSLMTQTEYMYELEQFTVSYEDNPEVFRLPMPGSSEAELMPMTQS
jgi:hypothetical protein